MTGIELRNARLRAGWTQSRVAGRLGVTQAYLSLMEGGRRRVPDRLKRLVTSLLSLPPTCLPLSGPRTLDPAAIDRELEQGLARLEYPGLVYRRRAGARRNPVELLLMGLSAEDLDPRLAEALPWLLLQFEGFNSQVLVARAKSMDLQNRVGFTVALARRVAESNPVYRSREGELRDLEEALERSRLAREDTYGRGVMSERMREWMRKNRSPEAEHWNLLTDLKAEHLPYARTYPGTLAELPPGR